MREREIDKCDSLTKYDSMLFAAIVGGDCDMGNNDMAKLLNCDQNNH